MYLKDVPHDRVRIGMVVTLNGEKGVISDFKIGHDYSDHGYIVIEFLEGYGDTIAWWPFLCSNLSEEDRHRFNLYGHGRIETIEVLDE